MADLADYFSGQAAAKFPMRKVSRQPWTFKNAADDHHKTNTQKLRELPHALSRIGRKEELLGLLTNLEYVEAKFAAGPGFSADLLVEYHAARSLLARHAKLAAVLDFHLCVHGGHISSALPSNFV